MLLLILAVVFVVFLLIGTPVSFVIGITAMTGSFVDDAISPTAITTRLISGIDTFPLIAGAFFILAGELMSNGSITKRLVDFSRVLIGRIRGGTAITTVSVSTFFAGISGSAVADLAAVGSVLTPAMKREGYDAGFSTALPVASSVTGPVIPPSVIMIIYAMASSSSVAALFLAGYVPGLLMGGAVMAVAFYLSVKRKYPRNEERFPSMKEFFQICIRATLVLIMPLIIIGGIISGVFTATESGNIAVVYALLLSIFIYREYSMKQIYHIVVNSAVTISIALLVISTATSFAWILSLEQIPQMALNFIDGMTDSVVIMLMLLNILLLIVGMFLDPGAAIIILVPVLMPIAEAFGLDPLHLGIIVCFNLALGIITPPVGVGLYLGAGIGKIPLEHLIKALVPFIIAQILILILITYVPGVSLFIPRLFGF